MSRQIPEVQDLHAGWFMEYTRGGKKVRKVGESLTVNSSLS